MKPMLVAGIGIVSAYGWSREVFWDGLKTSKSSAKIQSLSGPEGIDWLVARVPDKEMKIINGGRFAHALMSSTHEAVADAKERGWRPGARVGLIVANAVGDAEMRRSMPYELAKSISRRFYLNALPTTPTQAVMSSLNFSGGPVMMLTAACASSVMAILTAQMWIETGVATDVIVSGTEFPNTPEDMTYFNALGPCQKDGDPLLTCMPFQEGSKGFIPGEASATLILTTNSVQPYAKILGGATNHDPYHPISINPDLTVLKSNYVNALAAAGVSGADIKYFNAHGTGTKQNDTTEMLIVDSLFPNASIYSTKPLHGHCQGAAGAVELIVAALSYERGIIPAPLAVNEVLHARLLDGISKNDGGLTLKSSLGMGGHNASLVLAPPDYK